MRHLLLLAFVLFVAGVAHADCADDGYTGGAPCTDAENVAVEAGGSVKSLQDAVDAGDIGGSYGTEITSGVIHSSGTPATDDLAVGGEDDTADFFVDAATGDVTINGTVTADSFVSPPDDNIGGSIVLDECEDDSGAPDDCPEVGAGHSLSIKLLNDANPLNGDKTYSPGFTMSRNTGSTLAAFQAEIGQCLLHAGTALPGGCSASGVLVLRTSSPFQNGVAVDNCVVTVWLAPSAANGWDAAGGDDVLYLQMATLDAITLNQDAHIGDAFAIVNDTTGCAGLKGGLASNCADAAGSFVWQVHIDEDDCIAANDPYDCCTALDTGATCSAISTLASGGLQIEIDNGGTNASADVDNDADLYVSVECNYY